MSQKAVFSRFATIAGVLFLLLCAPSALYVSAQTNSSTSTATDNSAVNKTQHKTADQQSQSTSDREMTAKIRRAIVAEKSLSTYAHNVKIITQNGAVTLKGPVKSGDEKIAVAAKATEIAGHDKVTDQLTVKQ